MVISTMIAQVTINDLKNYTFTNYIDMVYEIMRDHVLWLSGICYCMPIFIIHESSDELLKSKNAARRIFGLSRFKMYICRAMRQ